MTAPNFAEFLRLEEQALAAQLRAVRSAITHAGEKGRGLEHHALRLLRRLLPSEYGLATGFVACARPVATGYAVELSPQTDVIVFDAVRGAPVVDLGSSQVLPLECVHAVVEVKASLYGSVHELHRWSAAVRQLRTRHYLVDPERSVDLRAEDEDALEDMAGFGGTTSFERHARRGALEQIFPPRREDMRSWPPVCVFALAFEYDREQRFTLEAARARLASAFHDNEGHLDGLLIPDAGVMWHEADDDDANSNRIAGSEHAPLATFRHRLLKALAKFPRPSEGATIDLRPYFDSPTP